MKNLSPTWEPWVRSLGGEDPLGKAWQPTPVFLAGESKRQRSLMGYSPWGHKELDMTEPLKLSLTFHNGLPGCPLPLETRPLIPLNLGQKASSENPSLRFVPLELSSTKFCMRQGSARGADPHRALHDRSLLWELAMGYCGYAMRGFGLCNWCWIMTGCVVSL